MEVMSRSELIAAMAEEAEIDRKDAENALNAFINVVTQELAKGNKVQIKKFGTFEISERAERTGINPHTREEMIIPASKSPKFKPSKALKDVVNE